jgi:hypothetical protein
MDKAYKDSKKAAISENDFLIEGLFYLEGSMQNFHAYVKKDGSLVLDDKSEAEAVLCDPFSDDIALFESNGKTYYVFEDHNTETFRANVPGVVYPLAFKNQLVDLLKYDEHGKNLTMQSSEEDFVNYMTYFYELALEKANHPSKRNKINFKIN